jgi:hypothetical protein
MMNNNHKRAPESGTHKPIIAVDYENKDEVGDAKFLSIGRSTWDENDFSAKVFRETNDHWSSKSEELPLWRILDLATLIASVISEENSNLDEFVQDEDHFEELKAFLDKNLNLYIPRLIELKRVLSKDPLQLVLNKVRFLPWIGKDYDNGVFFSKRILILGESHHCGECDREVCENDFESDCREFTKNVVKDYLSRNRENARWMNTFVKFERSLIGDWTDEEIRETIWNSVSFYNYLQYALDGPRKPGDNDAYLKAIKPYYQVLDYLKPEIIIVWGKRLWDFLPDDDRWEGCDHVVIDGYRVENCYYKISDGSKARAFPVYHPSIGYDWSFWHKVIKTMIEL